MPSRTCTTSVLLALKGGERQRTAPPPSTSEPATATLYDAARKPSSETQRWQARTTEGGRPASSDPST